MSDWVRIDEREPEREATVLLGDAKTGHSWPGYRTACHCAETRASIVCAEAEGRAHWHTLPCLYCEMAAEDGTWYRYSAGDQDPPAHPTHWMEMPIPIGAAKGAAGDEQ